MISDQQITISDQQITISDQQITISDQQLGFPTNKLRFSTSKLLFSTRKFGFATTKLELSRIFDHVGTKAKIWSQMGFLQSKSTAIRLDRVLKGCERSFSV
jgi:hypothetical protein